MRLDQLGDVLMTTPAIRALRESSLRRSITLLTSGSGAAVAPLIPEIDRVIVYDAPWVKATSPRENSLPEFEMVRRLRKEAFDAAVIFTVYSQNPLPAAFLCYLAGIPLRLAHCHENPYQMLTHWVHDTEPHEGVRHECRRQLDLVASVGCRTGDERMSLRAGGAAKQKVLRMLREAGVNPAGDWAVIHPGATAASRRYPPEHFAEVCRLLESDHGWRTVLTGSRDETELAEQVRGGTAAVPLAGQLNLEELGALLSIAPLLISNNTGPVHMAAALGTPVVDLYALTNPQHTPWGVPSRVLSHDVPCKYCYKSACPQGHHHCLRLISPDMVVRSAVELREETAGREIVARIAQ